MRITGEIGDSDHGTIKNLAQSEGLGFHFAVILAILAFLAIFPISAIRFIVYQLSVVRICPNSGRSCKALIP